MAAFLEKKVLSPRGFTPAAAPNQKRFGAVQGSVPSQREAEKKEATALRRLSFTLIEMLMVVVIFSIICAGLGLAFISGVKIWQRAYNRNFSYNNALLTVEEIAKELRQSIEIPSINIEGDKERITFPTMKRGRIVKVTYEFRLARKAVVKKQMSLEDVWEGKKEKSIRARDVLPLQRFSLSYFYFDKEEEAYLWKDSWGTDEEGYLLAVKITAKLKNEEIVKVIFYPPRQRQI